MTHSFPNLNQSIVPCLVLTVASWLAYRFLLRQVRWSGIPISLRISQFVVIHTVKGFSIVSEAEVDVFWELPFFFFFLMIQWILALWSLVSLSFLNPVCASGSSQFMYFWSLIWRILSITQVKWMQLCSSLNILWHCPTLGLDWDISVQGSESEVGCIMCPHLKIAFSLWVHPWEKSWLHGG